MKYNCICQSCNYKNEKWNGEHCAGCSEGSNFVPIGQEEEDPYQTGMDDAWRQSIKQEDYSDTCKRLGEVIRQEPCDDATLKDIFCMGCEYREQEPKWDRLYSWLNDMRFGIAPDERVTDIDERNARIAQVDILDEIMEWMIKAESEDKE